MINSRVHRSCQCWHPCHRWAEAYNFFHQSCDPPVVATDGQDLNPHVTDCKTHAVNYLIHLLTKRALITAKGICAVTSAEGARAPFSTEAGLWVCQSECSDETWKHKCAMKPKDRRQRDQSEMMCQSWSATGRPGQTVVSAQSRSEGEPVD